MVTFDQLVKFGSRPLAHTILTGCMSGYVFIIPIYKIYLICIHTIYIWTYMFFVYACRFRLVYVCRLLELMGPYPTYMYIYTYIHMCLCIKCEKQGRQICIMCLSEHNCVHTRTYPRYACVSVCICTHRTYIQTRGMYKCVCTHTYML